MVKKKEYDYDMAESEYFQQADVFIQGGNESQIRRQVAEDSRVGIVSLVQEPRHLFIRLHGEAPFPAQMAARLVSEYPGTTSLETLQAK